MVDYVALANKANTLVVANGRVVTIIQFDETPQSASEPWLGPVDARGAPNATVDVSAVFVEPSSVVRLGISSDKSTLVTRSTKIMIIAPGATFADDLSTFHEVIDGSIRWMITETEQLFPGDVSMLWFVGVKR